MNIKKLLVTQPSSQPVNNKSKDKKTPYPSQKPHTTKIEGDSIDNNYNSPYQSKPVSKFLLPIHLLSLGTYYNTVSVVHFLKRIIGQASTKCK